MCPTRIREIDMKKNKITEQIHVLGTTFKDIYEIADYSCKEMPKDGVYVGPCSASWRQTDTDT